MRSAAVVDPASPALADESVASFDVSVRNEILTLLARLRDELGLSGLVVTHAGVERSCRAVPPAVRPALGRFTCGLPLRDRAGGDLTGPAGCRARRDVRQ